MKKKAQKMFTKIILNISQMKVIGKMNGIIFFLNNEVISNIPSYNSYYSRIENNIFYIWDDT